MIEEPAALHNGGAPITEAVWVTFGREHSAGAVQPLPDHSREEKPMRIRPLQDRVIVKRVARGEDQGGIIIPDTARRTDRGRGAPVGNGKILEDGKVRALDIKAATACLSKSPARDQDRREEHLMMREEDILGMIGNREFKS